MKKNLFYFLFCFFLLFSSAPAFGGFDDFAGTWKNMDANTGGITKLRIAIEGSEVRVNAWGKCHPEDCDWGEIKADAYGPSASSNIQSSAQALIARYKTDFSSTILVITRAGSDRLKAEAYTSFRDGSGRSNYAAEYTFNRARIQAVVPGVVRPMQPVQPIQPVKEDCISFSPDNAKVVTAQGRWKIADGTHWMFDFGEKRHEAERALSVIKHYRTNQSCFVGRPDPSLQYLLVSGRSPEGSARGEDCVSFNPDTIEAKNVNGRWKIVDGSHWLFDFEGNEAEARDALNIIKQHGFTKSCFVGRPEPDFQYLRK